MKPITLLTLGMVAGLSTVAHAQFFEDFDTDTSASWIKLYSDNETNHEALFSWDYFNDNGATPGFRIPSAPNSVGGTTRGLKLRTNITAGVFSGLSASPVGQAFTANFDLTADVWLNYLGPGPLGGSGTTQLANMGWGTAGTVFQTSQNTAAQRDSVFLGVTLDGGSAQDYRLYANDTRFTINNGLFYAAGNATANVISGIYASGDTGANLNNTNAYWTTAFPSVPLSAAQAANYPTQTGTTAAGTTGFQWRVWKMEKRANILRFYIDGTLIATTDLEFVTIASEPNILIGMMDSNAGLAIDPNALNSMIVDNVRVQTVGGTNQDLTGTLSLGDTNGALAFNRNISYEVMQGTVTVASGAVVANNTNTPYTITLPAAVTGAVTIKWDGSSWLKRASLATLTGSNQALGTVTLQNGDVDESGEIDAADIDLVIANFGSSDDINSDVDVSGEVDAADIDIVIANFGGTDD